MLRDYQIKLAEKAHRIIVRFRIVYLALEMRVGKTLISLKTAELLNVKNVLFITKKKAIKSIESDYERENFSFRLTVINYEKAGKVSAEYDLIIVDEAHSLGAYPKPSQRTKKIKEIVKGNYLILLSGTPSPESYSQLFHQFWISDFSPFPHSNFYKWAREFVHIRDKWISGRRINDYSRAKKDEVMHYLQQYMITYTREEAGFKNNDIDERVITVPVNRRLFLLIDVLLKHQYYQFKDGQEIVCDTPVKLQSKIHQICSGTVKTEDGDIKILSKDKAEFIVKNYKGKKIAIFYQFVAEGLALKSLIDNWTDDPQEFNRNPELVFISQIQSGSMGINLSAADVLIFYNINFSSVQYWQARARLQDLNRDSIPQVHWLFSDGGIEQKIYQVVLKKKDYTNYYFKKHYLISTGGNEKADRKTDSSKNLELFAARQNLCC